MIEHMPDEVEPSSPLIVEIDGNPWRVPECVASTWLARLAVLDYRVRAWRSIGESFHLFNGSRARS